MENRLLNITVTLTDTHRFLNKTPSTRGVADIIKLNGELQLIVSKHERPTNLSRSKKINQNGISRERK
jgi:hypothetical protein